MKVNLTNRQSLAYKDAVYNNKRVVVFGGAIRGGKTWWLLITLSSLALMYERSRWVIIRKTLPDLKRTTFPSFQSILFAGLQGKVKSWNKDTNVITFNNDSELLFMTENYSEDKDLNRFRGLEVNGAGLDEVNELQEATFYKVQERIGSWNQAKGAPPIVCLATCNPANNWVKEVIYKRYKDGTLPEKWSYIPSKITDNPYIPKEYLESLKELPPIQYARFVEGDWDVMEDSVNPFLYEFNDRKHIDDSITINPNIPVYFSLDFNVNPLCGLVIQQVGKSMYVVDEITAEKGSVDALCDIIEAYNIPTGLIRITGDSMGAGRSIFLRDNSSAYMVIKKRLRLSDGQFIIPQNPTHKNSRIDCNAVLKRLEVKINSVRCKGLLYDCKRVECDSDGKIIKQNRNKMQERADYLDCFRYFVNAKMKPML